MHEQASLFLLGIGRGGVRFPPGVEVDEEPTAAADVIIDGGARPPIVPPLPPSLQRVQREINGWCKRTMFGGPSRGVEEPVPFVPIVSVVIPRPVPVRPAEIWDADLELLAGLDEEAEPDHDFRFGVG